MSKNSYNGSSNIQQVIFSLAAFCVVVAGMKLASEILIVKIKKIKFGPGNFRAWRLQGQI